jgi:O-antigen ligase
MTIIFDKKLSILDLYILFVPLFAAYDRYYGQIIYEQKGYILRFGITQVMLILIFLISIKEFRFFWNKFSLISVKLVVFFFIYIILSYYFVSQKNEFISGRFWGWIPYYFIAFYIGIINIREESELKNFLKCLVISVTLVIISRYLYQPPWSFLYSNYRLEVNYIYLSAVIYSQVLIMVFPLSLYFFMNTKKLTRLIFFSSTILLLTEIIFTQTRGAYLSLFATLLFYFMKFYKFRKGNLFLLLILFIAFYFTLEFLRIRGNVEESNIGRMLYLSFYLSEFLKRPILGYGFGSEGLLTYWVEGAHNTFLSIAYDLGSVGLLLFLAHFIYMLKSKKSLNNTLRVSNILSIMKICLGGLLLYYMTTGNNFLYSIPLQITIFTYFIFAAIINFKEL